jgi:WhiB family redox-sensing transcriptional regulator
MTTSTVAGSQDRDRLLDWQYHAACRGADPELFFPDFETRPTKIQVKTAKLICRGCPVQVTCLNWALDSGQESGIWGGLTEAERHRLQRRGSRLRPAATQ